MSASLKHDIHSSYLSDVAVSGEKISFPFYCEKPSILLWPQSRTIIYTMKRKGYNGWNGSERRLIL